MLQILKYFHCFAILRLVSVLLMRLYDWLERNCVHPTVTVELALMHCAKPNRPQNQGNANEQEGKIGQVAS